MKIKHLIVLLAFITINAAYSQNNENPFAKGINYTEAEPSEYLVECFNLFRCRASGN